MSDEMRSGRDSDMTSSEPSDVLRSAQATCASRYWYRQALVVGVSAVVVDAGVLLTAVLAIGATPGRPLSQWSDVRTALLIAALAWGVSLLAVRFLALPHLAWTRHLFGKASQELANPRVLFIWVVATCGACSLLPILSFVAWFLPHDSAQAVPHMVVLAVVLVLVIPSHGTWERWLRV